MFKTEAQIKLETPKMDGSNPQGFVYVNQPGNDNRMADGYQGIPDSGLANEYMRLQDDFVKWQQQLLQNQQLLHHRVAPIAANPPVLNNSGLVNNMLNQSASGVPQQQQQRKPVEITIPIRLVDSDEEDSSKTAQSQPQPQPKVVPNQTPQRSTQVNNTPSSSRFNGPNVSIDSWQDRPNYVVITQPTVIEPSGAPRPFANQQRQQTVFHSAPNEWQNQGTVSQKPGFQQIPQNTQQRQQNIVTPPQQNVSRPEFYPAHLQQEEAVINPQQNVSRPEFYQVNQPKPNFTQEPPIQFRQMPQANFQEVPLQNHYRKENSQEQLQNFEQPHQPLYSQTRVYNNTSAPESNAIKFSEKNVPFASRSFPQNLTKSQQIVPPPVVDKSDDGIDARFSSVVTLSNDKNDQNVPQKDKVRSVVLLNNSTPQTGHSSVPFSSKIINAANKGVNNRECDGPPTYQPSDTSSVAPMSSRLVQQAVQQPYGGNRVSPPKVEQRYSPPKFEQPPSPPKVEQYYQPPTSERQPSPPKAEPSLPFGEVKLRHVESPQVSPPKMSAPEPFVAAPPPPPPPPPSKANTGAPAPPPPPPPAMSEADRRSATGKKILGAAYTPQLDAREELMMAIRQFGGSHNLRKSAHPPPH